MMMLLTMLEDEEDALQEEISAIVKMLQTPDTSNLAICRQNKPYLKKLLAARLKQLFEARRKRIKRYFKKWARRKKVKRSEVQRICAFIDSFQFISFFIFKGMLDSVLDALIQRHPRSGIVVPKMGKPYRFTSPRDLPPSGYDPTNDPDLPKPKF